MPEELTADQEMTLTDLNGVKCRINLKNERVSTENIKKIIEEAAIFLGIPSKQAWYSNDAQRKDMIDEFFCLLWREGRNNIDVVNHGMKPTDVWNLMKRNAFGEFTQDIIVDLIETNIERQRLTVKENGNVKVSDQGRNWGDENCNKML